MSSTDDISECIEYIGCIAGWISEDEPDDGIKKSDVRFCWDQIRPSGSYYKVTHAPTGVSVEWVGRAGDYSFAGLSEKALFSELDAKVCAHNRSKA